MLRGLFCGLHLALIAVVFAGCTATQGSRDNIVPFLLVGNIVEHPASNLSWNKILLAWYLGDKEDFLFSWIFSYQMPDVATCKSKVKKAETLFARAGRTVKAWCISDASLMEGRPNLWLGQAQPGYRWFFLAETRDGMKIHATVHADGEGLWYLSKAFCEQLLRKAKGDKRMLNFHCVSPLKNCIDSTATAEGCGPLWDILSPPVFEDPVIPIP